MKKTTFIAFTLAIWVIAVFSLIAVRYLIRKTSKVSDFSRSAQAYFKDLDPDIKRNISVLETAIIRLKDGAISIIGTGFERELEDLLLERRLSIRKMDFFIENPVVIERKMMAGEAFKTLNNAEKKCFMMVLGQ